MGLLPSPVEFGRMVLIRTRRTHPPSFPPLRAKDRPSWLPGEDREGEQHFPRPRPELGGVHSTRKLDSEPPFPMTHRNLEPAFGGRRPHWNPLEGPGLSWTFAGRKWSSSRGSPKPGVEDQAAERPAWLDTA